MSHYVDGFVIPVAKARIEDYKRIAEQAAVIWKEHGALDYWECVADDVAPAEEGMVTFPELAKTTPEETVVFSWVVYPSKDARDKANAAIHTDPRMAKMMEMISPIFDFKRMAFGGFTELVHA